MASRASISAVAILLVSLAIVFILVGNSGVSTGVYVAGQPTNTPAPTMGPSPTPLPDPAVENWQENVPGQLTYLPRPESGAQVYYSVMTLEEFASGLGVEPPPADAPYPQLTMLETMRDGFEEQIAELGLDATPDAIEGPAIVLVNGVPVSQLRVQLDAQEGASSNAFPGLDLLIGIIDRPGDEIELVQYRLQGTPDPTIYQDFRAWLESKAVEFAGSDEATETPDADEPAEPAADDAAEEPASEPETEPAEDATDEPADGDDDAAPAGDQPADGGAAATEPWNEVMPGVLMYGADPAITAQIAFRSMPVEEFATGSSFEMPAEDASAPMLDLLVQLRETLAGQLETQGLTISDDAFDEPEATEVAGKPAARLRLTAAPQTPASGQPFPGLDIAIVLVELPDGQLAAIQYTYQGAPEATVYAEFETWLDENADRATEPAAAEAQPDEPAQDAIEGDAEE